MQEQVGSGHVSDSGQAPLGRSCRAADPHKIPIDPNGNLSTKTEGSDTWTYTWNAENQLTKVEKNSVEQARFAYDPAGRRVEKVASGVTTSYTYDAEDILREVRSGTTLKYVHGPDVDEPLAKEDGSGALTYFQLDGLGSTAKLTNQAAAAVHEYRFDAWGNVEAGATEQGYAFAGREWDLETGLYYYRARYYDPTTGRFLAQDPIGLLGDDVNLFAYVWNSPVNWSDPSGLKGRQRTARSVAMKRLRELMQEPRSQREEACFTVCQEKGKDPFATKTRYGTAEHCPITFCRNGSTTRAFCHVHPWVLGYPGHSPRYTGNDDFYWPDKLGVPSDVGQGGNIWEYDPITQKEKQICCEQ